jgi:hypothetical protein
MAFKIEQQGSQVEQKNSQEAQQQPVRVRLVRFISLAGLDRVSRDLSNSPDNKNK